MVIRRNVQFPILILHKGFFIKNGTRKRNAPHTIRYVDPKIPTRGCAVRIAKNCDSEINESGLT
jgi:hypothetical protein